MNVFGQRARSWRKSRKRGVSPIIATILLVAITVVLAAVLYVLISGLTHGPGSTPIGSAFTAGNPIASNPATVQTYAATGCLGGAAGTGHYCYTLTIESSTVAFNSVLCQVKTSAGAIQTAAAVGGFSIVNIAGAVVAQSTASTALAMTTTFTITAAGTAAGITSSTTLTNLYTIVIDMGSVTSTTGQGFTFVVLGTGSFSGTTSPLSLP